MNIIILYINILDFFSSFGILYKDKTSFVVIIKDANIDKVYNSQFIKKLLDLYIFLANIF